MTHLSVTDLIPVLQTAIGPVILISGVGLLLLGMTNRFSRIIDRTRTLNAQLTSVPGDDQSDIVLQLNVLWRQSCLIRTSIYLAAMSAFWAALLIIVIFVTALLRIENAWLMTILFSICMISLIASLVFFIRDIRASLTALRFEIKTHPEACSVFKMMSDELISKPKGTK